MVAPLIAAAAIGAGAGLLGGFFQNSSAKSAAKKQMKFQEKTLRHQYQWGMEDMRKAGLNPILAYKQGGAGSASGSSYTPQNIGASAVQGASTAAASAIAQQRQNVELENIRADTGLKNNQSDTQTALQLQSRMAAAQSAATTGKTNTENALLGYAATSAKAAEAEAKTDYRINQSQIGQYMRMLERGKRVINPFNTRKN
ncbi:MAG: DNA pilot protein [Microviridae sp.]|nr:MAG: DNA pilot protein [Microviridae sp.]